MFPHTAMWGRQDEGGLAISLTNHFFTVSVVEILHMLEDILSVFIKAPAETCCISLRESHRRLLMTYPVLEGCPIGVNFNHYPL